MTRSQHLGTLGGILLTLAVLALILSSAFARDPLPMFPADSSFLTTTAPVDDAPPIAHVLPAHADAPSIQRDNALYYLYILDRDGNPVHEFECQNFYYGTAGGINCSNQNNDIALSVGASVPVLLVQEQLPLKGESR